MPVYLDNNATTCVDERVRAAMQSTLVDDFGNASSRDHRWGWDAADAVDRARDLVAAAAGVSAGGVTFVAGATEALNMVLRSYVGMSDWPRKTMVTCATEHDAVLAPSRYLCERTGIRLEVLPVDACGGVDCDRLASVLDENRGALVALMMANNEIGTIHPIRQMADIAHTADGLLLCDTTQAFGRMPVDLTRDGVDFATMSAHKIHGPKGTGALLARRGDAALEPLIVGGGQERGRRGGTLASPGIVGLGEACRLVQEQLTDDIDRMTGLRNRLELGLLSAVPDAWVNGDPVNRLCNTSNMGFRGVDARAVIRDMHDVAVSTRSACSSGNSGPSHVLTAIGLSDEDAYSCIRFSLGRFTTEDDIDYAIEKVVASVHRLRRAKSVRAEPRVSRSANSRLSDSA